MQTKEQLIKVIKRYQLFLWPGFAAVGSSLLVVTVLIPQALQLIKANHVISKTSKDITIIQRKIKELEQINDATFTDNINMTRSVIPTERDVVSAISQVQTVANSVGVRIDNLGFGNLFSRKGGEKGQNLSLQVSLVGSTDQLKKFFLILKDAPRVMKVESVDVNGSREVSAFQITLGLKAYYELLPSFVADIVSPLPEINNVDLNLLSKIGQSIRKVPVVTMNTASGSRGKDNPFQ